MCGKHWILNYRFTDIAAAVTLLGATLPACFTEMLLRQKLDLQGIFFNFFFSVNVKDGQKETKIPSL